MRGLVAVWMLAACGRLGFDAHGDVTGDGARNGDGAQPGDATGSGGGGLVQQSPVVTGNGTVMVPLPLPTAGGTFLVATIAGNDLSAFTPPAGWQSNVSGSTTGACGSVIATEQNAPAGQTMIVFTINTPCAVQVTEWQGLGNIDNGGFSAATSPSTAFTVSTLVADSLAGDLAIATFCQDSSTPVFTVGAGWTQLGQVGRSAALPSMVSEYQKGEPKAQITATAASSASAKYAGTIVTFAVP